MVQNKERKERNPESGKRVRLEITIRLEANGIHLYSPPCFIMKILH